MDMPKGTATKQEEFINQFAKFYEKLFKDTADTVEFLADIQKDYKKEYKLVQEFEDNPVAIQELITSLNPKEQATLLKLLLNAGGFGKRIANILDLSESEKRTLSEDLRTFAKSLSTDIKTLKSKK